MIQFDNKYLASDFVNSNDLKKCVFVAIQLLLLYGKKTEIHVFRFFHIAKSADFGKYVY